MCGQHMQAIDYLQQYCDRDRCTHNSIADCPSTSPRRECTSREPCIHVEMTRFNHECVLGHTHSASLSMSRPSQADSRAAAYDVYCRNTALPLPIPSNSSFLGHTAGKILLITCSCFWSRLDFGWWCWSSYGDNALLIGAPLSIAKQVLGFLVVRASVVHQSVKLGP